MKKRLALIIPSFFPAVIYGGPIFSSYYASKYTAKLGDWDVFVSTTNANMNAKLDVQTGSWVGLEDGFFVKYYNELIIGKLSLSFIAGIVTDIRASNVCHIQSIFNYTTVVSIFIARSLSKPIVISPRGQLGAWCLESGSKWKQRWLSVFIKPFAKSITWHATSDQEELEIREIFGPVRVAVIPNGIETEKFSAPAKYSRKNFLSNYGIDEGEGVKLVISMGRLHRKKGFDILIRAFQSILANYPNSILMIAGPDEGAEEGLDSLISDLRLRGRVLLIGSLEGENKREFLKQGDVFVLPSHNENFGNVFVESLACGTPIVASKNTPWESVEKYKCGRWVENNVEAVTTATLEILGGDSNDLYNKSKALAKQFDWAVVSKKFNKLFEGMI